MATCRLVGSPCATYGPYTFYKAFKYIKNGKTNIISLSEFFFVKLWIDSDLVSIAELTLLWVDRNNEQTLVCLRLYILPENTPDGRNDIHGEDEVLSITEKVVLRLDDLLTWIITDSAEWSYGLPALWCPSSHKDAKKTVTPTSMNSLNSTSHIDFTDVEREKSCLDKDHWEKNQGVVVLSFMRYCRYRSLVKRYEGTNPAWQRSEDVIALGGFHTSYKNTRVLFAKETFDYPDLEGHELLCNHLAPKYKGRTKKRKKLLITNIETDSGSETSSSISNNNNKSPAKSGLRVRLNPSRKSPRTSDTQHERDFLHKLYQFMKMRKTPIGKVPTIGFKEVDLYKLYHKVKHLGGYDEVTTGRLWKYVFAEVGGEQGTTSSGTLSRKHYERLLLPYEKHMSSLIEKDSTTGPHVNTISAGAKVKVKDVPSKANKVNGNVSALKKQEVKESPVITLEESSNSSSNSNSNLTTSANGMDKDKPNNFSMVKRKIVMEGNSSSLRNARLKLEKPQNGIIDTMETKPNSSGPNAPVQDVKPDIKTNGQVSPPRDKENIPLVNKPGEKRLATPEVIDISDDSGPQSINAYKKQKLDILKYQGLEVTPVSSEDVKPPIAHPPPNLPPTPIVTPQASDSIQRERNKISITVTPDVSLLIKPQTSPVTPSPPPRPSSTTPKLFSNPPVTSNLFTPYPHGNKTVYGNPKEVLSSQKETPTFPSPKEQPVYSNPKDLFNTNKDMLYNKPKDLFSSPKDLLHSSKDLYNNSKDLFNSKNNVYTNSKSLFNSPKDLYNNPPKELLYPSATSRDGLNKSKNNISPSSTKDIFNGFTNWKDMLNSNNFQELLKHPSFRDMLGNPNFKDFFSNPSSFKNLFNINPSPSKDSSFPNKSSYLSPSKDNSSHYQKQQQQQRFNNSLLGKSTPSNSNNCDDVLDLKVKPHPSVPATLSTSGHSIKRPSSSQAQDEVLDLTVKSGKKGAFSNSNLEITLLPSTPSHRPFDMKRPLPLPLSRTSSSSSSRSSVSPMNNKHPITTSPSSSLHKKNHSQFNNHNISLNHQQHNLKKNLLSSSPNLSPHNSHSLHSNRAKRKQSSSIPIPPSSRTASTFSSPSHSRVSTPTPTSQAFTSHLAAAAAAQSSKSASPYMHMLDPMYFAALYSGLFPPNLMNPAAAAAALFTPPVSGVASGNASSTSQEAMLIMYKELLKAQNSSLFPNLFTDGATSISLVGNNNKPSPK